MPKAESKQAKPTGPGPAPGPKATGQAPLTRSEIKALKEQIRSAREALMLDKANRPKRQLTQKQLDNLAKGRALNSKYKGVK